MKKASFFVYTLVVRCRSVPFDMMRYDHAVPATEEDSNKLRRMARGLHPDHPDPDDLLVEFRVYSPIRRSQAEPRWESFGCEIVSFAPRTPT